MRLIATFVVLAALPLAAQDKPAKKPAPPAPIAITGCIERSDGTPATYTLRDDSGAATHRLTGMNVRGFVGQRVELMGGAADSKRLQIKTGLLPNPNVAAQAGAIDPSQAATAAAGGSAPVGDVQLPEFRVRSVKALGGGCK
ncbi:MAG TPA: hypothetical protein VIW45_19950 [Vicinamibacterales bacterium]|jgi:hypothetical protein